KLALNNDGINDENIILKRICDCRYEGQGYELRVDAPSGEINESWIKEVEKAFHEAHEKEYTSKFLNQDVIAINIRVIGLGIIKTDNHIEVRQNGATKLDMGKVTKDTVYFWIN